MESIFFEKQEGALCAQHALNALLQGPYFTAVDLATIARTLDAEEREVMGQGGVDNPEYLQAFQQDSYNMDDTGFFSVQVITAALRVWNLRLVPYTADEPDAALARADPTSQNAYICNFREHWFTIRKFAAQQWVNLNSILNGPELITPTYLHLFLSQLQTEGYSIFIVDGALPQCPADVELLLRATSLASGASSAPQANEDPELAAAVALSLGQPIGATSSGRRGSTPDPQIQAILAASARELDDNDVSLKEAIARSMADRDDEDLKAALLLSIQNGDDSQPSTSGASSSGQSNVKETGTHPIQAPSGVPQATPDVADLRAKRAAFLDRLQNTKTDGQEPEAKK